VNALFVRKSFQFFRDKAGYKSFWDYRSRFSYHPDDVFVLKGQILLKDYEGMLHIILVTAPQRCSHPLPTCKRDHVPCLGIKHWLHILDKD
jgi:hypothetical protein